MQTNTAKLRGAIAERNISKAALAEKIGMDRSTFYRKMQEGGGNFTISQAQALASVLQLDREQAADIFLSDKSHKRDIGNRIRT